jgi:hypothetical protein
MHQQFGSITLCALSRAMSEIGLISRRVNAEGRVVTAGSPDEHCDGISGHDRRTWGRQKSSDPTSPATADNDRRSSAPKEGIVEPLD